MTERVDLNIDNLSHPPSAIQPSCFPFSYSEPGLLSDKSLLLLHDPDWGYYRSNLQLFTLLLPHHAHTSLLLILTGVYSHTLWAKWKSHKTVGNMLQMFFLYSWHLSYLRHFWQKNILNLKTLQGKNWKTHNRMTHIITWIMCCKGSASKPEGSKYQRKVMNYLN